MPFIATISGSGVLGEGWHHVAAVLGADKKMTLYVDGMVVALWRISSSSDSQLSLSGNSKSSKAAGLLGRAAEIISAAAPAHRYAVVSDSNVAPLYASLVVLDGDG